MSVPDIRTHQYQTAKEHTRSVVRLVPDCGAMPLRKQGSTRTQTIPGTGKPELSTGLLLGNA
eukprot:1429220-Rhodomonas_salina.4